MDLSKNSIVSRHFSKKMVGGLNEFEVRDFLHVLAEEIRHLTQLTKDQNEKLTEQEEMIRDYRDREHILKQSISSAQEISDRIRRDAEAQAQLILDKSQDKSDSLIQEARHSLQSVYNDISDLKRLHLQFKTSLKAALHTQMELLEQGPLLGAASSFDPTNNINEKILLSDPVSTSESKPEDKIDFESKSTSSMNEMEDEMENTMKNENKDTNPDAELNALKDSLKSLDKDFF